ncbi:MAG TPA: thiamine phosphate synthase [Anaeromyxobacteraceae bacterium]|nr:thiamine phosphate synthase [Anaeromyxobacteraceae bacterium]
MGVSTSSPARAGRLARLAGLYAIVGDDDPVARAGAAIAGGARAVQVRMKRAPAGEILEVARRVVALAQGRALVLVNDRPDLALLAGADGVHVGDEDLPPGEARAILGPDLLVGRTARTADDARAALLAGADHVGFGPVFPSATKPLALPPRGLEALADACAAVRPAPVVAVSGIDLANVAAVGRAGAACAAVIGALFDAGGASGADGRARALAAEFVRGAGERR